MTENQPNMEPNTMSGPMTAFIEDAYQDELSLMTELRDFLAEVQAAPEDPNADRPQMCGGVSLRKFRRSRGT
jgi:hypothetical protein